MIRVEAFDWDRTVGALGELTQERREKNDSVVPALKVVGTRSENVKKIDHQRFLATAPGLLPGMGR